MKGLIGKKIGMTQVWDKDGRLVAVTILEVGPCPVVQKKTVAHDGYDAIQVGFGAQKAQRLAKSAVTIFNKAGVAPCRKLHEFAPEAGDAIEVGQTLDVGLFDGVSYVDVQGVTIGRGFAGVVRRYRMAGGPFTHGGHSKRRIGSIGARDLPGWIQKGKKMPGHMGAVTRKVRNLAVVQVRKEDNLLLVAGAVPGAAGAMVLVTKALKKG